MMMYILDNANDTSLMMLRGAWHQNVSTHGYACVQRQPGIHDFEAIIGMTESVCPDNEHDEGEEQLKEELVDT